MLSWNGQRVLLLRKPRWAAVISGEMVISVLALDVLPFLVFVFQSGCNWVASQVIAVMFNDPNKRSLVRSFSYRTRFALYTCCTVYSLGKFNTLHTHFPRTLYTYITLCTPHTLNPSQILHASHTTRFPPSTWLANFTFFALSTPRVLSALRTRFSPLHALPTLHTLLTTYLPHLRHFLQSTCFAHFTRSTHSYSRTLHTSRILNTSHTHGLLFVFTDARNWYRNWNGSAGPLYHLRIAACS